MDSAERTPLISKTAFICPYCGAFTTQTWYKIFVNRYGETHRVPIIPDKSDIKRVQQDINIPSEPKADYIEWVQHMSSGRPFFEKSKDAPFGMPTLENCNVSLCYNCREIAVWVHDKIVFPANKIDIQPNEDLTDYVKSLFNEARGIVADSPKGAAALLRLCIQHLCIELGESGKNLDKDIANLVSKGLNPLVQQALDIVRVIGNESVHPGEIDLNDKRETAIKLFDLVNLIADQMISHPKQVKRIYSGLPANKREGIEQRNTRAIKQNDEPKRGLL
jgi:hypothetical protein